MGSTTVKPWPADAVHEINKTSVTSSACDSLADFATSHRQPHSTPLNKKNDNSNSANRTCRSTFVNHYIRNRIYDFTRDVMSLNEAYSMAHTAQCRLNIEANRPDRNLRFVVGHLMHYESLRLRIEAIEQDMSPVERRRAKGIRFNREEVEERRSRALTSSKLSGFVSTTGQHYEYIDDAAADEHDDAASEGSGSEFEEDEYVEDDDQEIAFDDYGEDMSELSLSRFPSGSSRPPRTPDLFDHEPELVPDDHDDYFSSSATSSDNDEYDDCCEEDDHLDARHPAIPIRKPQPQHQDAELAGLYDGLRAFNCRSEAADSQISSMWGLPTANCTTRALATMVAVGGR